MLMAAARSRVLSALAPRFQDLPGLFFCGVECFGCFFRNACLRICDLLSISTFLKGEFPPAGNRWRELRLSEQQTECNQH
jgi:hypothetical protein